MRGVLKKTMGCLAVLVAVLCAAFFYVLLRSPVFEQGESYTFYLKENSSGLMVETDAPVLEKLTLDARGESVRYEGNRLAELAKKYRAELLFTEKACGVENYYFFSPLLGRAASVNGYGVNLHIAVGRGMTAAGTPLIFGGF